MSGHCQGDVMMSDKIKFGNQQCRCLFIMSTRWVWAEEYDNAIWSLIRRLYHFYFPSLFCVQFFFNFENPIHQFWCWVLHLFMNSLVWHQNGRNMTWPGVIFGQPGVGTKLFPIHTECKIDTTKDAVSFSLVDIINIGLTDIKKNEKWY